MNRARISITSVGLAFLFTACSSGGGGGTGGTAGGTGGSTGGSNPSGGNGGTGGSNPSGGNGGTGGSTPSGGSGGSGATGGSNPSGGNGGTGGSTPTGGAGGGGNPTGGAGGSAPPPPANVLVTSGVGAYWKIGTLTEATTGNATVTVNDTSALQKWEGFGGAFNEIGWNVLTTPAMQTEALKLLFSATDGAHFTWGRIPIGASDYAITRYTLDDTGTDVPPNADQSNRPPADLTLTKFSLDRDGQKLIPYIKAAQQVNPALRFWASPWTPPVWMKKDYNKVSGGDGGGNAKMPSYFDGGNALNDAAILMAYGQYYAKFVSGYKAQGINVEIVSPQNEPGYQQNYPSALWDKATYTNWIGKYLGPAMQTLGVKVMLGTLSNELTDIDLANGVLADATAKGFVTVVGAQWGVLDKVNTGTTFGGLPIWATEHMCGNYPFKKGNTPAYNKTMAPNDQAYGEESWGYIRDAITKGKVTSYSAWNMVLDKLGLGNDTSRDWKQDALLVADGGTVNPTPAYYVFRHLSQYVVPGANVVGTTGGEAVAFKNPDGSIVAVAFNSGAANASYIVAIGGKKFQFAMPSKGWATVKYTP